MASSVESAKTDSPRLHRSIGFYGLMFVSLGSIIGSGWLLGALKAAKVAGPASILSWVLTAAIMATLALIHAELGTAYPVAGGTARFPRIAFGTLAGFAGGWVAWLQAVALAPVEVEASLEYLNNIGWVKDHLNLLHADDTLTASGFAWATLLMAVFTFINLVGVKMLSESNSATVIWKTAVPLLTVAVLLSLRFHPGNFNTGGGFAPHGAHGIFAALPVGVVFALQGFEQAVQVGGEARNPQRDLSRAILTAMVIGTIVYLLLARDTGTDVFSVRGSYAGAIGIPQFMPTSLRRYAVDFNGDGRIDLTRSAADAVGSVANFLKEHGWQPGEAVLFRAKPSPEALARYVDGSVEPRTRIAELLASGLELEPAPSSPEALGVLVALGAEYRVGLQNFYVITRYNRSALYASAVSDLADALAARAPVAKK